VNATGHLILILHWMSRGLRIGKPQLVHFGGSIDICIALLLATLGAPCPPRRNFFVGSHGHSTRPHGTMIE
jgi:hypothetical protein